MLLKCGIELSSAKHEYTGYINGQWLCGGVANRKISVALYLHAGPINHKILQFNESHNK